MTGAVSIGKDWPAGVGLVGRGGHLDRPEAPQLTLRAPPTACSRPSSRVSECSAALPRVGAPAAAANARSCRCTARSGCGSAGRGLGWGGGGVVGARKE